MVNRSGTAFPLGLGYLGANDADRAWSLNDDGTFNGVVRACAAGPRTRLWARGPERLADRLRGGPRCGQVASAPFTISRAQAVVSLESTVVSGAGAVVNGVNWGTDECDGKVEVIESRGKAERVLAEISPGGLGEFSAEVDVKSLGGSGEVESPPDGVRSGDRRRARTPGEGQCVTKPRTTKTFESKPAKVVAPVRCAARGTASASQEPPRRHLRLLPCRRCR